MKAEFTNINNVPTFSVSADSEEEARFLGRLYHLHETSKERHCVLDLAAIGPAGNNGVADLVMFSLAADMGAFVKKQAKARRERKRTKKVPV